MAFPCKQGRAFRSKSAPALAVRAYGLYAPIPNARATKVATVSLGAILSPNNFGSAPTHQSLTRATKVGCLARGRVWGALAGQRARSGHAQSRVAGAMRGAEA